MRRTAALAALAVLVVGIGPASAMPPPGAGGVLTDRPRADGHHTGPIHLVPAHSGSGRRIVYSQRTMHVWALDAHGHVVRDWPVSGRRDRPAAGTYHVFSKALWSRSSTVDVGFRWMVRFAHGRATSIGFHNIPYDSSGDPIQSTGRLGHPVVGGGCVRSADADADWLYHWARVGTTVVVVP